MAASSTFVTDLCGPLHVCSIVESGHWAAAAPFKKRPRLDGRKVPGAGIGSVSKCQYSKRLKEVGGGNVSTFVKIASGLAIGVLLCVVALGLWLMQQARQSADAAPQILKQQFSSENLSSNELELVIERGYRAQLWNELSAFFRTQPTFHQVVEVLGPPDQMLRDDQLARFSGKESLAVGAANVLISYKTGLFFLPTGEPADTFSVVRVYFRETAFATWAGAGLYSDDPLATLADSRIDVGSRHNGNCWQ